MVELVLAVRIGFPRVSGPGEIRAWGCSLNSARLVLLSRMTADHTPQLRPVTVELPADVGHIQSVSPVRFGRVGCFT